MHSTTVNILYSEFIQEKPSPYPYIVLTIHSTMSMTCRRQTMDVKVFIVPLHPQSQLLAPQCLEVAAINADWDHWDESLWHEDPSVEHGLWNQQKKFYRLLAERIKRQVMAVENNDDVHEGLANFARNIWSICFVFDVYF